MASYESTDTCTYSASEPCDPWESHCSCFEDDHGRSSTTPEDYICTCGGILMKHLTSRLTSLSKNDSQGLEFGDSCGAPPKTLLNFVHRLHR